MKTGFLRIALLTLMISLIQGTWALASTTGSIEGKVTDQNGNGINSAKVTALSPSQSNSVTTGPNGFYSILDLSPDTYTVTASKDGYDSSSTFGITVRADQPTAADIKLSQTVKTLGHVTTTATASVVSKTVTGDLYAVNAQAINNYQGSQGGAETLYSQNGVVASLPGVVRLVGSGGGYAGQGTLSLRGGSFDQVGYELDGVPLNRGFDFYNATTGLTNGLATLQVYTGGAPADAGRAMAGYINSVIQRGKYPGGADFSGVLGSPLFNHTVQADVYGGTPDNRFTYYVSTLGLNSYFNFGDRSNLANTSFTVPANDPNCGSFNRGPAPPVTGGGTLNCSVANVLNEPVSEGAYASNPFNAARDTATNLHYALQHNGLNDDVQALYVVGSSRIAPFGMYGTVGADPAQASSPYFGYSGDTASPTGSLQWPTGFFYSGAVGQPYNPALLTPLTWPTSAGSVNAAAFTGNYPAQGGPIPPTFTDSENNQYSVAKLSYTRALTQSSFLRVYGYSLYSFWSLDQPINGVVGATFYQLHDNATGVTFDYDNQIDSHNLVKFGGDWSRDESFRYNYGNWIGNPFGSSAANCAAAGAAVPCAPGTTVTAVSGPLAFWNTVNPLNWDGTINDTWKPSDKLLFDIGLRWDQFGYQLMPMKMHGNDGIAYLAEETQGHCLDGFPYSPSDPKIIGPNGNQNCFQLLTATGTAKDLPGAAAWQDATGSLTYEVLSPRFGTTWTVGPHDVARFSVGRYVQTSGTAFEQYRQNPLFGPGLTVQRLNSFYSAFGFQVVHNVLPEDSTNYDLSLEHEFNGGMSLKLTPFYRNTRNQIIDVPIDPLNPTFVTGYNFGDAHTSGAEFLFSKNVTGANGIGGTLATTFTNTKLRFTNPVLGESYISQMNGLNAQGACTGAGICGYNQYYHTNYAMLDPNAFYSPSYVMAPTLTGPSWDVAWVINLTVDARTNGFDILPTFNYQSGNPYGDPRNFPDPHCAAPGPAPAGSGCVPLPAGITAPEGGNGPDPYTKTFDAPGSLKGPSWWSLNLAVAHDIGHNLKASILGTNLLAGIHNQGYPWEMAPGQQNISYADNPFYNLEPLGPPNGPTAPTIGANPKNAYYGNNYYPYASSGILPYRTYIFSISAKM